MDTIKLIIYTFGFLLIVSLQACSTRVPPEIKQAPLSKITVKQVREQPDSFTSQSVRWGGIIVETLNKNKSSHVSIVALPLSKGGKPQSSDQSAGRFIAIVDEFLEPLLYCKGRRITVTGNILRTEVQKVGEFPYEYPVVSVDDYYLWPEEKDPEQIIYSPYWHYGPWFNHDFYPWPYPYRLTPYPRKIER